MIGINHAWKARDRFLKEKRKVEYYEIRNITECNDRGHEGQG